MPLASLPVLMLFGERGPLIFNVAQLMAIVALLYLLARRWAAPWSAAVAVAMTGAATILPHFARNYSGDLFAVAAVLAGLVVWVGVGEIATQERVGPGALRAFGAGVLVGIGVISKLPFLVAPVAILVFIPSSRRRSAVCFGLGVLAMIALLCGLNLHLFGDPWSTAYDRIAVFDDGVWRTEGVGQYFDLPILEGIQAQLFDGKHGLWKTSPITLLSYLMWPFLWRRSRGVALCLASVAGVLFLFFSRYELWHVSYYGNRFLLLPIVLGALPLAAALDRLLPWSSRPRCRPLGRSEQPEDHRPTSATERFQLPIPSPPATFEVCPRFASTAAIGRQLPDFGPTR